MEFCIVTVGIPTGEEQYDKGSKKLINRLRTQGCENGEKG
jgi:hypothetical protein